MFLPSQNTDIGSLRQGDILSEVQIIGGLNLQSIASIRDGKDDETGWQVPTPRALEMGAVLSHCCELDRTNGDKVTSIIVAPLRPLDKVMPAKKLDELRETNLIDQNSATSSFLKYFFLLRDPRIGLASSDYVVDFSKLFSVRKQSYDLLLEKKVAQMEDPFRKSFSLKLALFFYRGAESAEGG